MRRPTTDHPNKLEPKPVTFALERDLAEEARSRCQ
jgi:hypothetical protein